MVSSASPSSASTSATFPSGWAAWLPSWSGPTRRWHASWNGPVITEHVEHACSDAQVNVVYISSGLDDILTERTGPPLFDKRRKARLGRGLEYWRILKREFGMESADAQLAKLLMFIKPARCASVALLGEALGKWEALGGEMTKPMCDDFKL